MQRETIIFNSRDELLRLGISKIVYIEADGNYTNIITVNKLRSQVRLNLGEMERMLAAELGERSKCFMRIGKSYIINTQFIYRINILNQYLVLSDYDHFAFQIKLSKEALKKIKDLTLNSVIHNQ